MKIVDWFGRPQVDKAQLHHILRLIETGKTDGTLVHGGRRHGVNVKSCLIQKNLWFILISFKGAFIEPTIFVNVPTSSPIYQEEVFGPVVIVNTFTSEEDALAEANSTDFGLFCMSPLLSGS
jgi:acyl-CoA reductase-like NAD-dependent aldehyde dehydrogenase